ncbi:retropepsin-like aspartic protease family protein [Methylobacterium organophilum]|uniref:Transmembrane signal peptide protein n=1 Tax=Methylobacterium organophilum TaxID=410 RepID=A0ABQ4T4S9_METOR|nr:TIGR02281 family clan AA aspartic protease [Methylobacterium organophilum]GJE25236.1 hypothetical protein LKMONMHP_0069 [Methylobacterium organophilum]
MMWFLLGLLGLALVVLVATDASNGLGGLSSDQIAGLASGGALLILFGTGFLRRFREGAGRTLGQFAIWVVLFLVVIGAYAYREQAQEVGANLMGVLRPGAAVVGPGGEVTITRRSDGSFSVLADVNGQGERRFAFDTGASSVVLTADTAAALGIRPEAADFHIRVATANGTTLAAPTQLESITIGPITERRVDAMVSRPGTLSENLLGQSFLTRLPSYEVRGDRLILRSR